ncbi:MAG TPA: DedA family protein [Thermodesulfovibrionales bacterium]|nr:DedA family protein [Thermodesulfovibrionales bacterium]
MEIANTFIDIFLHLDKYLDIIIRDYGVWTYVILFLIIFCETGLVVTPFLPGDSLLFAAGTIAAGGSLDPVLLVCLLSVAAIAGNTVNYWIGHYVGPKVFHKKDVRFLNREYLERTHKFYEKHGGKTIIIARFIPIIRTFAPFVAGLGFMTHWRFMAYNISAGIAWIAIFVFGGYFFGNLPVIKRNFSLVIIAIIIISILPGVVEFLRHKYRPSQAAPRVE